MNSLGDWERQWREHTWDDGEWMRDDEEHESGNDGMRNEKMSGIPVDSREKPCGLSMN
jgi:hypothetical protein